MGFTTIRDASDENCVYLIETNIGCDAIAFLILHPFDFALFLL
jgi:hypothetical protein